MPIRDLSSNLRRPCSLHSIAVVFFCVAAVPLAKPVQAAEKPNVLFIICDDLNCDLESYDHHTVQTPNITELAQRGVQFDRAYCQYSLCGPSRASFMTGLYPDQTLIRRNAIYLREHLPTVNTMSQMYRDAGYKATRIGKIYHYNVPKHIGTSGHDDPYSWSNTFNPEGRDVHDKAKIFSLVPNSFGGTLSWLASDGTDEEQTDGIAADIAAEQLRLYAKNKTPFFLAVGLYRPHTPYVAPKKYFDQYPLEDIEVPSIPDGYLNSIPKPARISVTRKTQRELSEDLKRQAIQAYYASITFADAQIGKILRALDENGLADNTIVVFTSDHGYHMGEHGHFQKTTLFENAARVPLIIAGPGVEARGRRSEAIAEMVDFYPTLADLSGLTVPDYVQGVSLLPSLKEATAKPRTSALTQYNNGYSIRVDRYRFTQWGNGGSEGSELYDHKNDPAEMNNLAGKASYATVESELKALLAARVKEARAQPAGLKQIRFENTRKIPQAVVDY